jgi:hypothetical protein
MFPESLGPTESGESTGKVFRLVSTSPVGMCRTRPRLEIDQAQWDKCRQCPEFEGCYQLGMARVALQTAADNL